MCLVAGADSLSMHSSDVAVIVDVTGLVDIVVPLLQACADARAFACAAPVVRMLLMVCTHALKPRRRLYAGDARGVTAMLSMLRACAGGRWAPDSGGAAVATDTAGNLCVLLAIVAQSGPAARTAMMEAGVVVLINLFLDKLLLQLRGDATSAAPADLEDMTAAPSWPHALDMLLSLCRYLCGGDATRKRACLLCSLPPAALARGSSLRLWLPSTFIPWLACRCEQKLL